MSLPGVFATTLKNGTPSYRSSLTFRGKHISLGSYDSEEKAHEAYLEAFLLLKNESLTMADYNDSSVLSFDKWISLLNFRDNGLYFAVPIYLKKSFFLYYLSPEIELKFDLDDLFYYSSHKIMRRKGHLFVADYGMQVSLTSRYGIKAYAVCGRDYIFRNQDPYDFRYENIEIFNSYHGVRRITKANKTVYQARIHINGYFVVGEYESAVEAAIAYNKAVDILARKGLQKNYAINYIDDITSSTYADLYSKITVSNTISGYTVS